MSKDAWAKALVSLGLPRRPRATVSVAGVGLAALVATAAGAQTLVPHATLTPYQIVTPSGQCLQVNMGAVAWPLDVRACSPDEILQKFYVLEQSLDQDAVPRLMAVGTVNARVVLAARFDDINPWIGPYNLLEAAGVASVNVSRMSLLNANDAQRWHIFRVNNGFQGLAVYIADENNTFHVVGTRTVYYGLNGQWVGKEVRGFGQAAGFPCTNEFFGTDPAPGTPKHCFLQYLSPGVSPFQVKLSNFMVGQQFPGRSCLAEGDSPGSPLGYASCTKTVGPDEKRSSLTLRPTSYPM